MKDLQIRKVIVQGDDEPPAFSTEDKGLSSGPAADIENERGRRKRRNESQSPRRRVVIPRGFPGKAAVDFEKKIPHNRVSVAERVGFEPTVPALTRTNA